MYAPPRICNKQMSHSKKHPFLHLHQQLVLHFDVSEPQGQPLNQVVAHLHCALDYALRKRAVHSLQLSLVVNSHAVALRMMAVCVPGSSEVQYS